MLHSLPSSTRVLVHATFGKSALFIQGLFAAGYREDEIAAICTQIEELPEVLKYLPDQQVVTPASAPSRRETPWGGMAQLPVLDVICQMTGLQFSDLILADRHLRRRAADEATHWLNETATLYESILDACSPEMIIGETANASEVILAGLADLRGIPYVQPATLRVPSSRFGLWLGSRSEQLFDRGANGESSDATEFLDNWQQSSERPFYYATNSRPPSLAIKDSVQALGRTARRLGANSSFEMQRPMAHDYLELPWLNRFRKSWYARCASKLSWDPLPEEKLVFFPLHVQPEASIDWYPASWRNQLRAARIMSESLDGVGIKIVVKDHANFLWSRGSYFHEELRTKCGVVAVSPSLSSADIMTKALCTVTVSGTVGLEAGLRGLPALMVSDHPWGKLPTVGKIQAPNDIVGAVHRVTTTAPSPNRTEDWFSRYWMNSWPGLIADSHGHPDTLKRDNVEALGGALADFASGLPRERRPR